MQNAPSLGVQCLVDMVSTASDAQQWVCLLQQLSVALWASSLVAFLPPSVSDVNVDLAGSAMQEGYVGVLMCGCAHSQRQT